MIHILELIQNILNADVEFEAEQPMECKDQNCNAQIEQLTLQIADCDKEYKEIAIKYNQLLVENLKKDVQLEMLQKELKDERFNEFAEYFDDETLEYFRNFGNTKREDSSFILKAVQCLYADNLTILKTKSVTGQSKHDANKTAVTPMKRKILTELFEKRLEFIGTTETIDVQRKLALNKHIKTAITTVNKQQK